MTRKLILALALSAAALPAFAQFGNPAGAMPYSPEQPKQANVPDRLFVRLVGMGNTGEIDAARLADGRAASAEVKEFARRMAQDHTATGQRLAAVARPLNIPVPTEPDPDQKAMRARLEQVKGAEFDSAYLQGQLIDHQKTVTLLQWIISNGQDAGVQAFAKETLPAVMDHLRHVQHLLGVVTAGGPQGLAVSQPMHETTPRRRGQ